MPLNLKELIVVLTLSYGVLKFARPLALRFISADDLRRRCRLWYLLSAAAFLCPEFWQYVVIAVPLLVRTGRLDSNPGGLYLFLMHVTPPIAVPIRVAGIAIFSLDNYLLLSLCIVLPATVVIRRTVSRRNAVPFGLTDICLLAYGLLSSFLYVRLQYPTGELIPYTITDCVRRLLVFLLGTYCPFYLISRTASERAVLIDNLAAYCLSSGILASISIFEAARHWLLYSEFAIRWGSGGSISSFLARGQSLRAVATSGHPLALGYLLAIALGFWLYLRGHVPSIRQQLLVATLYCAGLIAAYSRGPWIGAIAIYVGFVAMRPRAVASLLNGLIVASFAAIAVVLTPLAQRFFDVIPYFGGTVDYGNILYRQRLWDRAMELIHAHPLLGDQFALLKMQDLRQGQGIIDFVNAYVQVMLDDGLIGLSLFLTFILVPSYGLLVQNRRLRTVNTDAVSLSAALASCIAGTLLMLANGGFASGPARLFYALAALATGYVSFARSAYPAGFPHSPDALAR